MKKKTKTKPARKPTPKAFDLHAAIQRQLRRVKVAPGTSPKATAANLKAFVDTLLEFMEHAASHPGLSIVARHVDPAPAPVATAPIQTPAPGYFEVHVNDEDTSATELADAMSTHAEPDPADWRAVLGIARGANVNPLTLKAALQANLGKPGALFAYQLAKAELGIP